MRKTKVLIIGAGPTGLMAACQLQQLGIDFIIIDQKAGVTLESRALILHARTLEIYDQMGLANDALLQGKIVQRVQLVVNGKRVEEMPLGKVGEGLSPFPFLLVLEQSKNEELLYKYLRKAGGEVEWNTELISVHEEEERLTVVTRKGGEEIVIQPDFIIAADGSKSPVRNCLDIPFNGNTYEHIFYVADAKLNGSWSHDDLTVYLTNKTFIGLFPMQGDQRFRIIGVLPPSFQNEHPENFDVIVPEINKELKQPLDFSDVSWFSVYRLHHRCMEKFRQGNVFFAGDAAHIHSPAGGQGMNTGLQDAYNLAWKIAMVVRGDANEKLLDTYEQERMPFARQLLYSTDRAFAMATSDKWYHRLLRLRLLPMVLPLLLRMKKYRLRGFTAVSQIGIKYIHSDLTVNRMTVGVPIKAGHRFPFVLTAEGDSVYGLMKAPLFHALVFTIGGNEELMAEMQALEKEMKGMVNVIPMNDETDLWQQFKLKRDTIILVRPDHYIGLITDEGVKVVGDYLRKLGMEKKEDGIKIPQTHL